MDTHFKLAGALIDPKAPLGEKAKALGRSALFYATWYPRLWFGVRGWLGFDQFGPLGTHMRFVERSSRKLARTIFHCMIRFGPRLEKRQAVLGRIVEIGAELFAMAATIARADAARKAGGARAAEAVELADLFCIQSRRRVREKFHAVWSNDDVAAYSVARKTLDGRYNWLDEGMVR